MGNGSGLCRLPFALLQAQGTRRGSSWVAAAVATYASQGGKARAIDVSVCAMGIGHRQGGEEDFVRDFMVVTGKEQRRGALINVELAVPILVVLGAELADVVGAEHVFLGNRAGGHRGGDTNAC